MRFSLARKITLGISLVACITYGTSSVFIFVRGSRAAIEG